MDFPLHIPDNVISCGPIYRKCPSLAESEPELDQWLRKPTILISLGSHVKPTETVAVQMAKGIKAALQECAGMQVLWKLQYDWAHSDEFQKFLGASITAGSVKVVSWIQSEIMAVLKTGSIAVYVHHGGANSYFEACKYVLVNSLEELRTKSKNLLTTGPELVPPRLFFRSGWIRTIVPLGWSG